MIEVAANKAEGTESNEFGLWNKLRNVKRNEWEAVIKVLVVLLLIPFGMLAFGRAFPNQYDAILFDNIMLILLISILSLGTILYGFIIFPRGQETNQKMKREKTVVTEEKLTEYFTHILAVIITVPLIVVTCVLLVGGNRSEELTFISGLLGVIIGFYFGYRGVGRAESQREEAKRKAVEKEEEAKDSDARRLLAEKENVIEKIKTIEREAERRKKLEAELDRYKIKEALEPGKFWDRFEEEAKRHIDEAKNINLEKIEEYSSGKVLETDLNDEEKRLKARFDEEWKRYGETKEKAWGRFKEEVRKRIKEIKTIDIKKIYDCLSGKVLETDLNDGEKKLKARFEEEREMMERSKDELEEEAYETPPV